ncbi:MAG: LuxR C-terminal-related transcriptional regulator [Treponema sp.]|nr:LuxR C-terminal-related transcriptional regulator [Treponema sp.]
MEKKVKSIVGSDITVATDVAYAFGYTEFQKCYHESIIRKVTRTESVQFCMCPTPEVVAYLSAHPEIIVVVTGLENGEVKHHMQYLHVLTNPIIVLGDTVLICYCLERMLERHRVSIMLAPQEDEFDLCYEHIRKGKIYVTRSVYERKNTICETTNELTHKQNQILECMTQMMTEREIALLLGIGLSTVKTHKYRIFEKFGIGSMHELWLLLGVLKKGDPSCQPKVDIL